MKTLPENYVSKGWGYEKWICNNERYCGKELFLAKGKKFSVHYHKLKDETFYVIEGKMVLRYMDIPKDYDIEGSGSKNVTYAMMQEELEPGDVFHVPVWLAHQAIALSDVRFIEFSTHHEDSDSYIIIKGD